MGQSPTLMWKAGAVAQKGFISIPGNKSIIVVRGIIPHRGKGLPKGKNEKGLRLNGVWKKA